MATFLYRRVFRRMRLPHPLRTCVRELVLPSSVVLATVLTSPTLPSSTPSNLKPGSVGQSLGHTGVAPTPCEYSRIFAGEEVFRVSHVTLFGTGGHERWWTIQTSHGVVLEDLGGLEQWTEVSLAKLVALNVGG